jgi:intracellular septation protein
MKPFVDFLPILLFFGAYKLYDIYTATAVLMAATVLQTAYIYKTQQRLELMHRVTLVLVLGFGALTLGLHDERFIKWKPTVLYGAMTLGLAFAHWVSRKNVVQLLLGTQMELPALIWARLNLVWMLYCAFMASINAYVAAYYSTEDWVNFKLWGYAFPLVFIIAQGLYIAPHVKLRGADGAGPAP